MSDSIAITSGKGGVGKTTFAVNLSIAQRKFTDQVFLLDTDMGMANSHVLLGVNPEYSISDVISGEKQISEISRYIVGKLVLKSTNGANTPQVKSVQFRALARPELVVAQIPINISDRVERPGRKPLRVKGLGNALYNSLRSKEGDSVTLEIFEPSEIIKGVVEQISYPIQSNDVVGSDTHYAIITVRGTRQGTIEEVTSIHTPGIAAWGIMRYGA